MAPLAIVRFGANFLPLSRRSITSYLLAALLAMLVVSCANSSTDDQVEAIAETVVPTATLSPTVDIDATATWDASELERERIAEEALSQQAATATAAAIPASTLTPPATSTPNPLPTKTPVPQRAISTSPVNRIAFSDGTGSIFTVNPDGTELVTIGDNSSIGDQFRYTFPVWSPDGGSVLFSSFVIINNAISQNALHRADADGLGTVVTLAVDPTSQSGVGPGIPHFSTWSPSGERIAVTTSGEFGIGSMILGSHSGETPRGIALGAPLYINWAPDGTSILVHQNAELHIISVFGDTNGFPRQIGTGSFSFYSPTWAPDSQSFAHIDTTDGKNVVVITEVSDLDTQRVIGDGGTRTGLGWSPDGKKIAIARSGGSIFQTLSIFDLDDGSEHVIHEGDIQAFWWSPDSSKIALVEESDEIDLAHKWSILDAETEVLTPLATQFASDDFYFVQIYFDQYADSHEIWSPDSLKIVISGALVDVEEVVLPNGFINLPDTFESRIWVLDAAGLMPPVAVGDGTIASWSSQ